MKTDQFVYVTYIRSTPQKVWEAITEPRFAREYWGGHANISDWKTGSKWQHVSQDEKDPVCVAGEVVESKPFTRLVLTWADPDYPDDTSRMTLEIEPVEKMVRLRVIHEDFKPGSIMAGKVASGWPLVLSSLKSYLETGSGINIWAAKAETGNPSGRPAELNTAGA